MSAIRISSVANVPPGLTAKIEALFLVKTEAGKSGKFKLRIVPATLARSAAKSGDAPSRSCTARSERIIGSLQYLLQIASGPYDTYPSANA